jgi:hypothetical protein
MPRNEQKQWKKLNRNQTGGGFIYVGKEKLKELEREGVIEADEPIEYTTSVGASDGRARLFSSLRNIEDEPEE